MKKMTNRFVALILIVCTLSVSLLPGMFTVKVAATDNIVEYDFSAAASLIWMNGSTQMTYSSRQIPDTNVDAARTWNRYYSDGTLNWSFEQILGSGGTVASENRITVKRATGDALQFSTVSNSYTTPVILYKNSVSGAIGWVALKMKAPAVGKYNVTLTYGSHRSNGSASGNVFLIPAFTYETAAAFNATIEEVVANGTGKFQNGVCYNASNGVDKTVALGTVTLSDSTTEEYFAVFSVDDTKRAYLQKLTFEKTDDAPEEETEPSTGTETQPGEDVEPPADEEEVIWITDKEPVTDYDYSFAIVGDPQKLTEFYPEKLDAMYSWIANNKESKKIAYCTTLGDLTNSNTKVEYDRINAQFEKLDNAGIPYGFIRGNHDLIPEFDTYITWEDHGNKTPQSGSFDGTMKNTWQKLTVGDVKYLFINMDYSLTPQLMAQISGFIKENRDYNVIASVHGYMSNSGARITNTTSTSDQRVSDGGGGLCGADLWEQLYSKHDNLVMVLCGHTSGGPVLVRKDKNVNGYVIPQLRIDPQGTDMDYDGVGLVAMFYFSENGTQLEVEYYSVDRDAYYREENQFKLELNKVNEDGSVTPSEPHTPNNRRLYDLRSFTDLKNAALIERQNTEWDLGGRDWKVAAYHSGISNLRGTFNTFTSGYTMYAKADPKWVAFQLRSPGSGTYDITVNSRTVSDTDLRTGTPMNAYLVPVSALPENPTNADYSALRTAENKIGYYAYGTGDTTGNYGVHTLESDGDYLLILEAAAFDSTLNANNFYLKEIVFNKVVATIGETTYTSITEAFEAAKVNDIVKLQQPFSGPLDVPAGVALDLNGYRCTTDEYIATTASEYIMDSAGGGVLDTESKSLFGNNGGYLPLYNEEKGGYTFHKFVFNVTPLDYEIMGNTTRFWFYIGFDDKAVYDLITTGNTGVKFGVDLAWGDMILDTSFSDDLAMRWAAIAKNNENVWLYVDVSGLSSLGEEILSVTPTIELDGHTYELRNGTISYAIA